MDAMTGTSNPSRSLIETLGQRLAKSVGAVVSRSGPVALLDFPNHNNIGDTAIWLGERTLLHTLGLEVAATADESSYSPTRIRRALGPDGTILLHGGGSFGDLWPARQAFRERVVREFPDHVVVQLPQTVSIGTPGALARMRSLVRAHGGVTLLVRDQASAEVCRNELGQDADVVPDAAFALGPLTRIGAPRTPILCLARSDHESDGPNVPSTSQMQVVDWFDSGESSPLRHRVSLRIRREVGRTVASGAYANTVLGPGWEASFELLARRRLARGLQLLSQGEVLVTDRLHGHVLALLLGIPHVVVDTRRGKVGNFVDAFTTSSGIVHRASTFADARRVAVGLLAASD